MGCVGESRSPATAPCGTGVSSMGKRGVPSRRSKTNSSACLVTCTTAGTVAPSRVMSTRVGWAGVS